jgi:uncharacterized protein (DUF433 family)
MTALAFTPTEAAAFLNIPERQIRKEVEHGLFSTHLTFQSLVYLSALRTLGLDLGVDDRKKLLRAVTDAVRLQLDTAQLSPLLVLKVGELVREVRGKIERFFDWKNALVVDKRVLAGEPAFPKSRLAVRQIGGMLERGAAEENIRADYPYLTNEDLEFSRLFVRAYPRVGRPRETRQASDR